jgi:hypothetical protein
MIPSIVGMMAAIPLLSNYSDGRYGPIGSGSVSLSGISESSSKTMGAGSVMFSGRIKQYTDYLTRWYDDNKNKFRGIGIG